MYARGYTLVQVSRALGIPYPAAFAIPRKAIDRTKAGVIRASHWQAKFRQPSLALTEGTQKLSDKSIRKPISATARKCKQRNLMSEDASEEEVPFSLSETISEIQNQEIPRTSGASKLSQKEAALLKCLVRHRGQTLTRARLMEEVWGYIHSNDMRTLDTHIARLRRKIEPEPACPRFIITVRGVGYRFIDC